MKLEKIKLIIWDLDDTFWRGTLSEGDIEPVDENIALVKNLTERGIVSSICSKNDYEKTENKLQEIGIWDYFVFASINWEPKGPRMQQLISDMALRPQNVLFIDDNHLNLEEARFIMTDIMTAMPEEVLPELYEKWNTLGKDDSQLSRLKQYRILETKREESKKSSSNEEFLRSCNIEIVIDTDCEKNSRRIVELINRSNQLNYTKKRIGEEEFSELCDAEKYDSASIEAHDRFGDYGIIGFYALNKETNSLEHFLFSCRTMGMGIEQYIYAKLGYPSIKIVGEVATELKKDECPDWITETVTAKGVEQNEQSIVSGRVLFKGPCDTESSLAFIKGETDFDREFTFVNENGCVIDTQNTTFHILDSVQLSAADKEQLKDILPVWDDKLFETGIFCEDYKIVFLSLFMDPVKGLYRWRRNGVLIAFDDWYVDATSSSNWDKYLAEDNLSVKTTRERLEKFAAEFEYVGRAAQEQIVENVRSIRKKMPPETLLVISIPTTFKYIDKKNPLKNDRDEYNKILSEEISRAFTDVAGVEIIDYTDFANKEEDFLDTSNHFTKMVYYEAAQRYISIMQKYINSDIRVADESKVFVETAAANFRKVLRKNKMLVKMVRKINKRKNRV